MSDGLNRVILLGNVGQDPELRFTQSGTPVLSLSLATNESYLDKNQQRQERAEWHSVVVWGKRGEGLATFVKQGFGLLVEGSLRTRTWDDKDGRKCYKTEIIASNVIVTRGESKDKRQGQTQHRESHANDHAPRGGYSAPRQAQAPKTTPANDAPPEDFGYDSGDDYPF